MISSLLALSLLTASQAPAACGPNLRAEIDHSSFTSRDEGPAPAADALETLRQEAELAFNAATARLCAAGEFEPEWLSGLERLIVQSASGASETAVYVDEEGHGTDALIFQWVFVEEGLALPDEADIEMGIKCWVDPDVSGCAERMP